MKKSIKTCVDKIMSFTLGASASSTTSVCLYQPKAPAELKKFSKIKNDK